MNEIWRMPQPQKNVFAGVHTPRRASEAKQIVGGFRKRKPIKEKKQKKINKEKGGGGGRDYTMLHFTTTNFKTL
jgi:hypothetical protein